MTPGRIAAVITSHNLGGMLLEALESVERQTRPASEIIVVDDASTDTCTREVLARLEGRGVRVVQAGGGGVSAARNLGAQLTAAEYLMWLDGDDVLEPGYFEAAGAHLDSNPGIDFVSCAMRAFGAANYVWSPSRPTFVDAVSTGGVPHSSSLLRRGLWERTGGFDESLRSFELLDFWATAIEHGFEGAILAEPLLNYRVRPGSGYRRSIQPATYLSRLGHFYAKHRDAVERHGLELVQAKEAFFLSQRDYWQTLEARAASLEAELSQLQSEIAEATRALSPMATDEPPRPAPRRSAGGHAAILAYHRIADLNPDSHGLCMPPDVFREHMACLRQHFSPIPLDFLVRAAASGRIPERAVAVTLDDGYLDALTVASPILMELGVPATFFVNTDRLDEEHERWWDILERVFSIGTTLPPHLALTVAGQELRLPTATVDERADALKSLNRMAWPLDAAAREQLAVEVVAWGGADGRARPTHRVLTAGEIRALADRPGHSIGAHTSHHLALTTQPAETKRREVVENKLTLERLLQSPVSLFSYPYGECDAGTVGLLREAGFMGAVTVQPGLVSGGTNRLLLPRFEITISDDRGFPVKMQQIFEGRRLCV